MYLFICISNLYIHIKIKLKIIFPQNFNSYMCCAFITCAEKFNYQSFVLFLSLEVGRTIALLNSPVKFLSDVLWNGSLLIFYASSS